MTNPESRFPPHETDEAALEIALGGISFVLTHANTEIYSYRRYPEVNHIYHTYRDEGTDKQMAIFECPDIIEVLRELNFGERITPRPTEWDEKAFIEHQRQKLEKELDEL